MQPAVNILPIAGKAKILDPVVKSDGSSTAAEGLPELAVLQAFLLRDGIEGPRSHPPLVSSRRVKSVSTNPASNSGGTTLYAPQMPTRSAKAPSMKGARRI